MIQDALTALLDGRDLDRAQARAVMDEIMAGEATPAQIGGFLVALRLKGETPDEIAGFAEAIRGRGVAVAPQRADLVDTAGTGGDGQATINISTAAALVAAAAGAGVAKHGNRAVSSASGSADVLEALGFALDLPARADRAPRSTSSASASCSPPRTTRVSGTLRLCARNWRLGPSSTSSVLSPTRPARAPSSSGSTTPALVPTIAEVLARLDARRAFVVHGAFGVDELSPAGPNLVCEVVDGAVHERTIDPLDLGIARCAPEELRGGSPEQNAAVIRAVFAGEERGAKRDAILLNAAGAIAAGGHADDLREGLDAARQAVDSGAAAERLDALVAFSHG